MDHNLFYSKTEYPYPSTASSELDFVQHWVEQTVEKEIIRGKQLQQLKEITPIVKEYDVVDVDNGKLPFCEPSGSQSAKKSQNKKQKKRVYKSKKGKKEESACTCRSPKLNRKRKVKQKCPMRIAELAVPTKRRCFQNWINNKDILPDIMIHRLQQIIRDQRPVVKISDAIICFKTNRSKRKRKSKDCEKKDKKCFAKNLNRAKNLSDARVFCGVFGYRIGQILNKPMVIELSPELESIAKVVTMDVSHLLCKKQPDIGKIIKKKSVLDEIASKIAIWIWNILEEAYHLILEEQLRELEEEIGPVLDIIDDLVDNVVGMCYVESIIEDNSSESSINAEDLEQGKEEHEQGEERDEQGEEGDEQGEEIDEQGEERDEQGEEGAKEHEPESKKDIHPTDSLTDLGRLSDDINTHITNQIRSIINNIFADEDSDELSDLLDEKLSENILDDKEFVDADDLYEDNFPKPSEQIENPEGRDEEGNQVSDDFNDGKKVTFSHFNTVTETNSIDMSAEDDGDHSKTLNWKASLSKFAFAEPNEHLLSDADETWPNDIKYEEIIKGTISINKSISSMGKIFETEEKASMATENKIEPRSSKHLRERELDEVTLTITATEPDKPQLNDDLNKLFKKITESKAVQTSIDKSSFIYYKKLRDAGINTSPSSSTTSRRKKGKTVTSLSLADFSKKPTKPRLNYKVYPSTAPAWAMQEFYKSNEGSSHKRQINTCQIRKWCNDLQTGYNNLKLWGNWLEVTSRMVMKLEQNKANCCPNKQKQATKWLKLKKEINDDASVWNKKHRCTSKQFAEYKDLYRDHLLPKINCKCSKKRHIINIYNTHLNHKGVRPNQFMHE